MKKNLPHLPRLLTKANGLVDEPAYPEVVLAAAPHMDLATAALRGMTNHLTRFPLPYLLVRREAERAGEHM